jgi:hypothetical protein
LINQLDAQASPEELGGTLRCARWPTGYASP